MRKFLSFSKYLICLLCFFLFIGCATVKKVGNTSPVFVTNTKSINLLSPICMDGAIDNLQLLTGSFGNTKFSLLAYFQSDDTGIFLALMNNMGTDMGNLTFDGEYVSFETSVFPAELKPEYIIADIQYAFYKSADVEANLAASKLKFTEETVLEETGESVRIRRIMSGKKLIEEIQIQQGKVVITNLLRGYEYCLEES